MTSNQLFEKLEHLSPLDFGDIFNKSIELFKKVWLQGFVHLLISFLVILPLIVIMYIPMFAIAGMAGLENQLDDYQFPIEEFSVGLLILFFVLILVISMAAGAIQMAITAHFYRVCKQVDLEQSESSSYFMFLKGKYLGKVFALSIAIFGISLLAILACYLPIFYVMIPLQLIGVIFAFNPDLSASDIIKASFKLGNKKWLILFGLIIVGSMLSQFVGMILCFVGIFFTASFVYLPVYFVYKETVGFEEDLSETTDTLFVK